MRLFCDVLRALVLFVWCRLVITDSIYYCSSNKLDLLNSSSVWDSADRDLVCYTSHFSVPGEWVGSWCVEVWVCLKNCASLCLCDDWQPVCATSYGSKFNLSFSSQVVCLHVCVVVMPTEPYAFRSRPNVRGFFSPKSETGNCFLPVALCLIKFRLWVVVDYKAVLCVCFGMYLREITNIFLGLARSFAWLFFFSCFFFETV